MVIFLPLGLLRGFANTLPHIVCSSLNLIDRTLHELGDLELLPKLGCELDPHGLDPCSPLLCENFASLRRSGVTAHSRTK
jgi:hypothetical protein